jgi:histidine ammonia-lyase
VLDGDSLNVYDLAEVARSVDASIEIDAAARQRVAVGRRQIEEVVARYSEEYARWAAGETEGKLAQDYGVTTGFGEFKSIPVPPEDLEKLQQNLLLSHSVGIGENDDPDDMSNYFSAEVVRASLVIRVNAFLKGHSGVRPELVDCVVDMFHSGIVPLVPTRGSLGSSGDLCPLSHLFAVLLGAGRYYNLHELEATGKRELKDATRLADDLRTTAPVRPSFKEGLGLSNGATFSTALLALAVYDAEMAAGTADVACALTLEASCGCARAFDPKIHNARGQKGQQASAANIRRLIAGSHLVDQAAAAVQDPYSVRCAPAVHGATRDAIAYSRKIVERELNAATDNPLFFPGEEPWDFAFQANWPPAYDGRDRVSYSAGNFHGQPIAVASDFLTIAVAELANISERRTQMLLDARHNRNLPANLIARRGVNSGLMITQYSAASLVNENKVLAHPASVDSIPTAANVEDHVAMATTAARKLRTVLANVKAGLGIELLVAAQGVEWRTGLRYFPRVGSETAAEGDIPGPVAAHEGPARVQAEDDNFRHAVRAENRSELARELGSGSRAAYLAIRGVVAPVLTDRPLDDDIRHMRTLVAQGNLLAAVAEAIGPPEPLEE